MFYGKVAVHVVPGLSKRDAIFSKFAFMFAGVPIMGWVVVVGMPWPFVDMHVSVNVVVTTSEPDEFAEAVISEIPVKVGAGETHAATTVLAFRCPEKSLFPTASIDDVLAGTARP